MVSVETYLDVADNTGAQKVQCIRILGHRRSYARVGDIIVVSVKIATPDGMVKKKEVCKAVIVRTKQHVPRPDGSFVYFDKNAVVLIDDEGNPKGTRIFGPVVRELREKKFTKIVSMAPEVV